MITAFDIKKNINSSKTVVTPYEFLTKFYEMREKLQLQGSYFNVNSLWVIGKPSKSFYIDGVLFYIQIASGTYRLLGLPITDSYEKLVEATKAVLDLGLNIRIDRLDLPEVTQNYVPEEMNDNYNYWYLTLKDYWTDCSRQSRKIHNQLERNYSISLFKPVDLPIEIQNRITEINDIWIDQFKENNKKSKQTLSYIDNVFKQNFLLDNARFIIYTNNETGIIEAYDYIEAWGKVGIAAAGKAIIEGCSTFKHVTIKIVEYLKSELGADHCMLGGSNFYSMDGTIHKDGNPGLLKAKTSIPQETTFTYVYRFNQKKFASFETEAKSSSLF